MRGLAFDAVEVRFVIPFREIRSTLDSYAFSTIRAGSCGVLSRTIAWLIPACCWRSAHFGALLPQNGFP
jgi:hypothetical protein